MSLSLLFWTKLYKEKNLTSSLKINFAYRECNVTPFISTQNDKIEWNIVNLTSHIFVDSIIFYLLYTYIWYRYNRYLLMHPVILKGYNFNGYLHCIVWVYVENKPVCDLLKFVTHWLNFQQVVKQLRMCHKVVHPT